jgi:Domain of unknown function (DUF4157)
MALRSHAHQKASPDTVSTTVQHTSRPFAPQTKLDAEQTQALPELQTQLETAQRFGHHLADFNLSPHPSSPPIQPKLAIGAPGDKYEQEADRVAQQVVQRLNAPQVERAEPEPAVQRQTPEEEELQMKPMLQMRENARTGGQASPDLESAINQARGGGQSLDTGLQRSMGQAMGANFSRVRVHTDDRADQLNRSIQARAFTTGQNVFFRQGAYQPGSRGGQELLAHELTHVVQQSGGAVQRAPQQIQKAEEGKKTETEATRMWRRVKRFLMGKKLPASTYRWEPLSPELVSQHGIPPRKKQGSVSLKEHVTGASEVDQKMVKFDSQWISTGAWGMLKKLDPTMAHQVLERTLFKIDTARAEEDNEHKFVDVNKHFDQMGQPRPYPSQREWAIEGGIPPRAVVGWMTGEQYMSQYDDATGGIPGGEESLRGWQPLPAPPATSSSVDTDNIRQGK